MLLAALPFTGLGVIACLSLAVVLSCTAVVLAERRRTRRTAGAAAGSSEGLTRGERAPMSAVTGAGIALGAVVVLVYVVFVIRAA